METPTENPYEAPNAAGPLAAPLTTDQGFRDMKVLAWLASACIACSIPYSIYIILLAKGIMAPVDEMITLVDGSFAVVFILGVILYCIWKYRCARNASYFYGGPLMFSPGWCVGYYFIPLLHLFRPYQCMKDIFEKTYLLYGTKAPTGAILIWWLAWVFGNFADNVATKTEDSNAFVVSSVLTIVGALLAIWVIMTLTRRQYEIVNDPDLTAKIGTINPYQGALPGVSGVPMQRAKLPEPKVPESDG